MTSERWQKIEQLYHAALEREEGQRATYLLEACVGDDELRREVESLLAQEKRTDGFLESPALEGTARAMELNLRQSLNGQQLGTYKIVSLLGAGGMGEVYQAHDTKLGRDVAIKVVPAAFVHDAERLARFQREARMLAALNHPNIATIHGLEQADGVHYLVMELVLGQTLAERVSSGALKIEEALKVAAQIAEALEAAHEKGVIHRDLKPANVKVTPEGRLKVLDFGLAKAFAGNSALDLSNALTLTAMGTEDGRILGTPAYMSPEQARGKAVDKRSDIWAFGCLLYELLTGRQAFHGDTLSDMIGSILEKEPDWRALPPSTPGKIRDLVRRCLQKDMNLRLQAAGDARIEINEALAAPATISPEVLQVRRRTIWQWVLVAGLACVVVAAIVGFAVWNLKPAPVRPVSRTLINLPPGDQLAALDFPAIAISQDGTQLAYVASRGGIRQIYLRFLDSLEARPLAGTEGANTPFFSPDGRWLGFFAGNSLKKISVTGGAALTLANMAEPRGASWAAGGTIVFSPGVSSPLLQIPDAGGVSQSVTHLEKDEAWQYWPEVLPDSKAVLFKTANSNPGIVIQSLATNERRDLIAGGTFPRYAASNHLIFAQGGNLMAAPFDLQLLRVTGAAVPVIEGVLSLSTNEATQYGISSSGALVYIPGKPTGARRLVWVNRNGTEQILAAPPHNYQNPRVSPDGRRVAVSITEQDTQTWLYDFARDTLTRLTFGGTLNELPAWSPDGKRIAFTSNREGPENIFWQLADGSGGLERLTTGKLDQAPRSFSPNGQLLAFVERDPNTGFDIWVLRMSDPSAGSGQGRKAQPFLNTPFTESAPNFSPDGHWLAYVSDESGRMEIYIQPYPGPRGKYQIPTDDGREPVWNPNGRELFYRSGDKMMAVDIMRRPSFTVGKPRMLFQGVYLRAFGVQPMYDVSPDGQRFLMIKPSEQPISLTQIVVVQNWFEELKQIVPTGKK
jgi:serine/threonine protein kinase/Tol biopolymer transport system component